MPTQFQAGNILLPPFSCTFRFTCLWRFLSGSSLPILQTLELPRILFSVHFAFHSQQVCTSNFSLSVPNLSPPGYSPYSPRFSSTPHNQCSKLNLVPPPLNVLPDLLSHSTDGSIILWGTSLTFDTQLVTMSCQFLLKSHLPLTPFTGALPPTWWQLRSPARSHCSPSVSTTIYPHTSNPRSSHVSLLPHSPFTPRTSSNWAEEMTPARTEISPTSSR